MELLEDVAATSGLFRFLFTIDSLDDVVMEEIALFTGSTLSADVETEEITVLIRLTDLSACVADEEDATVTDISLGRLMAAFDIELPVGTVRDNGRTTTASLDVSDINAVIAGVTLDVARDSVSALASGRIIAPSVWAIPEEALAALGRGINANLTTVEAMDADAVDIDIR